MELIQQLDGDCYDMPPLERHGKQIYSMPWPTKNIGCAECNKQEHVAEKRVLWNINEDYQVYLFIKVCTDCWPIIGWEAWTPPGTNIADFMENLFTHSG
jgi:hypothetical protein